MILLGPATILLVEDAESDALLIRQAFRKARFANPIMRVASGAEALSYLEGSGDFADRSRHPMPDFILLDLMLPDTNGLSLLKQIKSNEALARLPVVMVTGTDLPSSETDARAAGATGFFRKALRFEDLIKMVREIGGQWGIVVDAGRPKEC